MARRSNSTTANGVPESFDDEPISAGGNSGPENVIDEGGLPTVNPADFGSAGNSGDGDNNGNGYGIRADGTPAKKRGRKPGQSNGQSKKTVTVSVSGLEKTLIAIHTGIAAITSNAVWQIDDKEARALAEASANVARHYNAVIDPKWADIIVLIGLMGTMYAPRVIATFSNKKPSNAPRQSPQDQNVEAVQFGNLPNIPGVPMTH